MKKISALLRGEDASQPMMVQSTPIENNLCNFLHKNYICESILSKYNSFTCEAISSNYKIYFYVRLCEANGYMHIHLELDITCTI